MQIFISSSIDFVASSLMLLLTIKVIKVAFFLFYLNILNNQIYLSQDYQVNKNGWKCKVNIRIYVDEQGNLIDYVWLIILSYRVGYITL